MKIYHFTIQIPANVCRVRCSQCACHLIATHRQITVMLLTNLRKSARRDRASLENWRCNDTTLIVASVNIVDIIGRGITGTCRAVASQYITEVSVRLSLWIARVSRHGTLYSNIFQYVMRSKNDALAGLDLLGVLQTSPHDASHQYNTVMSGFVPAYAFTCFHRLLKWLCSLFWR